MSTQEPTNQDILDVMNEKFTKVDRTVQDVLDVMNVKFTQADKTNQDILDVLQSFAGTVDDRFNKIDKRFEQIDQRFEKIESTMVTKEYLDDKLFEVRGEIANLARKQDRKVDIIVEELVKRDIFDSSTASRIMAV